MISSQNISTFSRMGGRRVNVITASANSWHTGILDSNHAFIFGEMMCTETFWPILLTRWGRVTHICVGKLTNIGSDMGLSPGRREAIIWTNARILLIGPLETNFSEFLVVIHTFSFNKMHLKMSSAKWRLFGLGLNELIQSHPQGYIPRRWCQLSAPEIVPDYSHSVNGSMDCFADVLSTATHYITLEALYII